MGGGHPGRDQPIPIFDLTSRQGREHEPGRVRFGAHKYTRISSCDGPWRDIVFLTYFNSGLRAIDLRTPSSPGKWGTTSPLNFGKDSRPVERHRHGRETACFTVDRKGAGMHILEGIPDKRRGGRLCSAPVVTDSLKRERYMNPV